MEPIETTLERLEGQGYDAIEMFGEPKLLDLKRLRDIFHSFSFSVCGVTGMWGSISEDSKKRKLLSSDSYSITYSEKYIKDCIEMCQFLGGRKVNICLFADNDLVAFDRNHRMLPQERKTSVTRKAIPTLSKVCKIAKDYDVQLLLEPLNRYSTPYCSTAKDAIDIVKKVNHDYFGVLLDTFHMNIEEDSFEDAILRSKELLRHTHFADNNRKMPGYAHINFQPIVQVLYSIGYNEYISFEPNITDKEYQYITKKGLDFIKSMEKSVSSIR
jgi:sugar phosphate isomerase/epimerase